MGILFLTLSLLVWKLAIRTERLRQLAAQGDVQEVTLAPEQPFPDVDALNLPATIRWRLHPSFAMIWCLFVAFGGPVFIGGMVSSTAGFSSHYGGSLLIILACMTSFFAGIHMCFFFLMRRRVKVTAEGLILHQFGIQHVMRWEDIKLFACVGNERFEISSKNKIFKWHDQRSPVSNYLFNELLATPEQMDAFLSLIAAKTGLKLYQFQPFYQQRA